MNRTSAVLRSLGIALIPLIASGQTKPAADIESRLKVKLEKPEFQTTAGMVEAYDEAVKAYRAEVSRTFEKLMKGLPPNEAKALGDSHRAWLLYFESMRACVSYIYDAPGTIHRPVAMQDLKTILQHRLEEMCQMYLEWDTSGSASNPEDVPDAGYWCLGPAHARLTSDSSDPLGPSPFERMFLAGNPAKSPTKVR
jgi:hypothetical protein